MEEEAYLRTKERLSCYYEDYERNTKDYLTYQNWNIIINKTKYLFTECEYNFLIEQAEALYNIEIDDYIEPYEDGNVIEIDNIWLFINDNFDTNDDNVKKLIKQNKEHEQNIRLLYEKYTKANEDRVNKIIEEHINKFNNLEVTVY